MAATAAAQTMAGTVKSEKLSVNFSQKHSPRRRPKASARNTLDYMATTTISASTSKSPAVPGLAVVAALVVAIAVIATVLVFSWKHDHVVPQKTAPASQTASAPPGVAPPPALDKDGRFLFLLTEQGVGLSGGREVSLNDAHHICAAFTSGQSEGQIVQDIVQDSPGASASKAATFASTAIGVFCPKG